MKTMLFALLLSACTAVESPLEQGLLGPDEVLVGIQQPHEAFVQTGGYPELIQEVMWGPTLAWAFPVHGGAIDLYIPGRPSCDLYAIRLQFYRWGSYDPMSFEVKSGSGSTLGTYLTTATPWSPENEKVLLLARTPQEATLSVFGASSEHQLNGATVYYVCPIIDV